MNKQRELHALFNEHGYTGVVATNCDQGYDRYLKPGDKVSGTTVIESISEEKATALGIGYFIETRTDLRRPERRARRLDALPGAQVQAGPAAPGAGCPRATAAHPHAPVRLRPPRAHDNGWWWDKIDQGELHIQKCSECGNPAPSPPAHVRRVPIDRSGSSIVSTGKGEVQQLRDHAPPADSGIRLPDRSRSHRPRGGHANRLQRGRVRARRGSTSEWKWSSRSRTSTTS